MKQLDPKSVWLFFFSYILRWFIFILIMVFWAAFSLINAEEGVILLKLPRWLWVIIAAVIPACLIFFWIWARLTYRFYRYELRENGFRKELGVIRKKYVTIPYDRIQNVDIYRGLIARFGGLSDLQIQTAGVGERGGFGASSGGAEGRLPGLSKEMAEQLREELIQRAHQSKNQGL